MKRILTLTLVVIAAATCRHEQASPSDLRDQIDAELSALETTLTRLDDAPLPEPFAGLLAAHANDLENARQADDPLLALYRLREPYVGIQATAFIAEAHRKAATLEGFEQVWAGSSGSYSDEADLPGAPILQRALVESSLSKARVLREASLAYGRVTSPLNGLYYLAEAEGNRQYAGLVKRMRLPADRHESLQPTEGAVARGVNEVERQALEIFERDPEQKTAVPISAALKQARELLDRGFTQGAALILLESRMMVASNQRPSMASGAAVELETSGETDTVESLLLAIAMEEPNERDLIAGNVLPFYRSLRQDRSAPIAEEAGPVTVTLVRWPYT